MGNLYLMNSLITPFKGQKATFQIEEITVERAKDILVDAQLAHYKVISAIGHSVTAQALSILLNTQIQVNRVEVFFDVNDQAIVFVLQRRLAEGQVLKSLDEINAVGYKLYHVTRLS